MASTLEEWRVAIDAFTAFVAPDFDGSSKHSFVQKQTLPTLSETLGKVPDDFSIGVILGPSGSGKTQILHAIGKKLGKSGDAGALEKKFLKKQAVCSHSGFVNPDGKIEAVSRLSCVGLNRIPAWLRPYAMLSNGEASRVELALGLGSDAIIDNFAAVVDETTACSMASSLARFVRRHALRRVLVATSKISCVPFLCADFVITAETSELVLNELQPGAGRQPMISFDFRGLGKLGRTKGDFGWKEGELDDGKVERDWASELSRAKLKVISDAGERTELRCSVPNDAACQEAANAFEFEFTGETKSVFDILPVAAATKPPLQGSCLGAVLGPSGCGKSTTLAGWGDLSPLSWEADISVISHFSRLGMLPEKASELLEAVRLPRRCWLCPFHVLSAGEQQRAEVARRLPFGGPIDEFTSVLDRQTAKHVCLGVASYVRRYKDQFTWNPVIVGTVHEDIAQWLCPDWIWDAKRSLLISCEWPSQNREHMEVIQNGTLDRDAVARLLERPKLDFHILRLAGNFSHIKGLWETSFAPHHYLTGSLPTCVAPLLVRSADGAPVAFYASSILPGGHNGGITFREARMVILPEFQGLGLGPRLSDTISQKFLDEGLRYFSVTAHPSLGERRQSSNLWRGVLGNMQETKSGGNWKRDASSGSAAKKARACYRHQFIGPEGHGNDHLLDSWERKSKEQEALLAAREHGCSECRLAMRVAEYIVQEGKGALAPSALITKFAENGVDLAFLERHLAARFTVPEAQSLESVQEKVRDVTHKSPGKCIECAVACHVERYLRGNRGSANLLSLSSKFTKSVLRKQWPEATFGVETNFLMRHFDVQDGRASVRGFVATEEEAAAMEGAEQESNEPCTDVGQVHEEEVHLLSKKAAGEAAKAFVKAKRDLCTECAAVGKISDFLRHQRAKEKEVTQGMLFSKFSGKHTKTEFLQRHFCIDKKGSISIRHGNSKKGECYECSMAIEVATHLHSHSERRISKLLVKNSPCGCQVREAWMRSSIKTTDGFQSFLARWFCVDSTGKTVNLHGSGHTSGVQIQENVDSVDKNADRQKIPKVPEAISKEVKEASQACQKSDEMEVVNTGAEGLALEEQLCGTSTHSVQSDEGSDVERPRKRRREFPEACVLGG